jgi:Phage integrase family
MIRGLRLLVPQTRCANNSTLLPTLPPPTPPPTGSFYRAGLTSRRARLRRPKTPKPTPNRPKQPRKRLLFPRPKMPPGSREGRRRHPAHPADQGRHSLAHRREREATKAGKRLRAAGYISLQYFQRAVDAAAARVTIKRRKKKAGAPEVEINLGSFRHTVATWAMEKGADPAAVATFLNHRSSSTTKRFYATQAAPPRVPTLG